MAGFCTVSVQDLPTYSETLTQTDIPGYVAAGGKALFEQAAELAQSELPLYQGPRIASYDGSKLTPEEQQAFNLLTQSAGTYQPYLDQAYGAALGLGGTFDQQTRDQLIGQSLDLPTYSGATREELIGTSPEIQQFNLEQAQPFLDIYQQATDPAIREIEQQAISAANQARARAATGGAFGGSRLGLVEGTIAGDAASAAGDARAQAAREGLSFAAQQFGEDRAAQLAQAERDRAARFQAEAAARGQFVSDREALMSQSERDRAARFAAESAGRAGFETEQAANLRRAEQLQSFAPLVQGLQEQAASGMLSAGEARRQLDQMALDLAYADFVEQRQAPFSRLNFALGALKGIPYEQTQFSLSQGQQYVQSPSIYGQTLGGLGSLASAYYMMR